MPIIFRDSEERREMSNPDREEREKSIGKSTRYFFLILPLVPPNK